MAYNRLDSSASASPSRQRRRSSISFSSCFGGSAYDDELPPSSPQAKQGCSGIGSLIGRHRRRHTGDFRYDSFNYALNFDDGADQEETQPPNFSSRLPQSPPQKVVKITCS